MPTIIPASSDQTAEVARRLLDAADSADQVQTVTSGNTTGFSVPDDVAERAGFGDGAAPRTFCRPPAQPARARPDRHSAPAFSSRRRRASTGFAARLAANVGIDDSVSGAWAK